VTGADEAQSSGAAHALSVGWRFRLLDEGSGGQRPRNGPCSLRATPFVRASRELVEGFRRTM
jgi:hypothetical protein